MNKQVEKVPLALQDKIGKRMECTCVARTHVVHVHGTAQTACSSCTWNGKTFVVHVHTDQPACSAQAAHAWFPLYGMQLCV